MIINSKECMEDDLNTPNAITLIYELLKVI